MCDTACSPLCLNRFSRAIVFPAATLSRALRCTPTLDRGPACGKRPREEKRFRHNLFGPAKRITCVRCVHYPVMLLARVMLTVAIELMVRSGKIIHEATIFSE